MKDKINNETSNDGNNNIRPNLRADAMGWFFAKSEIEKEELKEKHFASEYIEYGNQWGFHFTFGQIEKMYISEKT